MTRVLVVGLDALDPGLVEGWMPELPNLRRLAAAGLSGPLTSIVQPVTPAAWTAMSCGRNQGHFGFTDFLYRPDGGYQRRLVHSGLVRPPTVARLASEAGLRALTVGLPVGYPPVAIPGGASVACFMAPSLERGITSPPELQAELLASTSQPYLLDVVVDESGEPDREALARRLLEFDRQRFDIARHLVRTRPWDLLFLVAMGTDRVGHYFMRHVDPAHRRHPADGRYADVMLRHYQACDRWLGELLQDAGDCAVLVVSDHGMQRQDGRVHLNRWLRDEGYLVSGDASGEVDWERTRAWAAGYGGQVFVNVRGRDPLGCVPDDRVPDLCAEIAGGLGRLRTPDGEPLTVKAQLGGDLFDGPHAGRCPDLCVQFDDLRFLASDRAGDGPHVSYIDPDGIDDGSHAMRGYLALAGPGVPARGRADWMHLYDVAPTILDLLGVPQSPDLDGQAVHRVADADSPYDEEDTAALTSRLQRLYLE